ncbi:component of the polarisome [Ophidiomyces ophidiicola]|uniref:component of the polarisome n=1 Tax=Ophidiomyces ophidiicola TaxID=1387563 RepID=UPI0020C591A4|nr:component of the polarisome [Ophidiomyces ophidiicola]KAI1951869.1 component of the polarisome [Ophidiomyces ophidiicola]KAI2062146.1 component of the polarisome [Ophidiomyces ophidiicola]
MSTVSMDGSEWSGINQYQSSGRSEPALSPNPLKNRGNLPTPPASGSLMFNALGSNPPDANGLAPPMRPNGTPGNPSPPSSVVSAPRSRASDGTLSDPNSRRYRHMEELLTQHHTYLKRFFNTTRDNDENSQNEDGTPNDPNSKRANRALGKLLRLSPVQFLELSTDVFDELQRRQALERPVPPGSQRPDVPPHLLPRPDFHEKHNSARRKLSTLHPQRFRELTMDVFAEQERRFPQLSSVDVTRIGSPAPSIRSRYGPGAGPEQPPRSSSRGPPPGPGGRGYPPGPPMPPNGRFPPRQGSLSAAPPAGLGINGETIPENAPYQKSFQSNTIVPNKSTLVEDDESLSEEDNRRSDAFALDRVLESRRGTAATLVGGPLERQNTKELLDSETKVKALQSKVTGLEALLKEKDGEIKGLQEAENELKALRTQKQNWRSLEDELTKKLTDAQNANKSLREDLDDARRQHDIVEREMQEHLEQIQLEKQQVPSIGVTTSDGEDWKIRFEELSREHQFLKDEFEQQQAVTEQVREQALGSLEEMRILASESNWEREESLTREIHRLDGEVKHWKNRYAKIKTQQRHLRSSSLGLPAQTQDASVFAKEHNLTQPDGLIKDVHITKFQIAIDELLRIARLDDPQLVLEQMKAVVVSVRLISRDIERMQSKSDDYAQPRNRAKSRVSATANNLITASKNFANSHGLSPVSLLDAAASHLTAAIVELIRHVKIRPSPENELDEDDDLDNLVPMQSPGYFSVAPSQSRLSENESVYSAISTPSMRSRSQTYSRIPGTRNARTSGQSLVIGSKLGAPRGPDRELEGLRLYLEDQTEGLVQSIQALVASIRAEDHISIVKTHVTSISNVVGNVVSCTEDAMAQVNANPNLRARAGPVVEILSACASKLADAGQAGSQLSDPERIQELTAKLPPIAFQIARETKELVQRVDQLEMESRDDDDFR